MPKPVPIIDLFAGPGGLGEGFTSLLNEDKTRVFKIALSIEKNEFAHQTLTLRSFVRQFDNNKIPDEYYQFVRGEIKDIEELYKLYPEQAGHAKQEAWKLEVGDSAKHRLIDKRIKEGLKGEKNFVLIGGPPCQAYSLVGRSRRQEADGLDENDPRVYLYREYYRILTVHQPPVFIMENVKGLLSAKVNQESVFTQVINDLKNPFNAFKKLRGKEDIAYNKPGYKIYSLVKHHEQDLLGEDIFEPRDFIIKSEEYGIPQTRHRVILLGIRDDLNITPLTLQKAVNKITVADVISDLPELRSGLSKGKDSGTEWMQVFRDSEDAGIWEGVDEPVKNKILEVIEQMDLPENDRGSLFVDGNAEINYLNNWYTDKKIKGFANHETRSHIKSDIYRYLFVACFAKINGRSPKLSDFPTQLLPQHLNITSGIEENKFADRFRVQLSNEPSKTVTSHISKDGHYYIHPDPMQCRSLTVREAARLQTFPDNYFFCGPRTEQYHQVGNAVPPYLAHQIAKVIKPLLLEL
ncbi:DNA cytosine methyltransferase [Mucilaginibacter sp. KACC 22773]|uniref:DNA cytosine methyltransferase n=1 Tax=Mucilaginibacter sp. KACC 22773 TaxID=3025671 RepID=UPI0023651050|nr:DNA cytosine methyltransferase [Mucilaginibacter sp. KACC 22773]WDF78409.1 DNA cytosine methyltransferase [Mucilaginibacter sp. KACC 22773]